VILVIKAEVSFQNIHPEQGPNVVDKNTDEIFVYNIPSNLTHAGYGVSCIAMWLQSQ
jgi:hypothetical protein